MLSVVIMTVIMLKFPALSVVMLSVLMLVITMPSVLMLRVIMMVYCYAECSKACSNAKCNMESIIMLNVLML
jgi:hypothetical protein